MAATLVGSLLERGPCVAMAYKLHSPVFVTVCCDAWALQHVRDAAAPSCLDVSIFVTLITWPLTLRLQVCREGPRQQPEGMLGVYVFCKRVRIKAPEAMAAAAVSSSSRPASAGASPSASALNDLAAAPLPPLSGGVSPGGRAAGGLQKALATTTSR
eukprot:1195411-Prorocentrum_minimum.AAC.9